MPRRLVLVAFIILLVVGAIHLERPLIARFLKLEEMRMPYMVALGIFISIALLLRSLRGRQSIFSCFGYGAIAGQVGATVSLSLANLFIQDGLRRNIGSLHRNGLFELFLMDSSVAFILWGWVICGVAFVLYEMLARKIVESGPTVQSTS